LVLKLKEHAMEDGHVTSFTQLFHFPEELEKLISPRSHDKDAPSTAVDIKQTPNDYIFYADVPGLTKSDIQVQVENGKTLVIKCAGKRKREEGEECKILRVERKVNDKFTRKFALPGDANADGITAACVDGVLSVTVPRLVPEKKSKSIEISVA
ncbi:hypothetical protein KI387_010198, partial [Taxus chinensis]